MDVSGTISVNRDIFGYVFRDGSNRLFGPLGNSDTFPATGQPTNRSLRSQLELASGRAINICLFLVDHTNAFTGAVSIDDVTKIQYAIQVMRDIYAQAPLGVRKIDWRLISPAAAGGYADILNKSEAEDLTDDFSGPNDGIDVFFVQTIGDAGGWSNSDGPCDKNSKDGLTGAVLVVSGSRRGTGVLLAHEVGHYLTLPTGPGPNNFMGSDPDGDGVDSINLNSTGVTNGQATSMRTSCFAKPGC